MAKSLKGRGVVSDTPVYEAGMGGAPGAAPPRPAAAPRSSGSRKAPADPLNAFFHEAVYGGRPSWPEEKAMINKVMAAQEAGGVGVIPYTDERGRQKNYAPVVRKGETTKTALQRIAENTRSTPEQLIAAAGGPEQLDRILANNQAVAGMHHMGMVHGAQNAARTIGTNLLSEEAEQQALALRALGVEEAALRSRYASQLPADAGMPQWLPRMNNLTPVQTGMAYGLAAAGMGAAGVALANHLMAKGQQQSDPVHYAAAMQALNAYA